MRVTLAQIIYLGIGSIIVHRNASMTASQLAVILACSHLALELKLLQPSPHDQDRAPTALAQHRSGARPGGGQNHRRKVTSFSGVLVQKQTSKKLLISFSDLTTIRSLGRCFLDRSLSTTCDLRPANSAIRFNYREPLA